MRYLRQNTATIVTVGPFFNKTDGVTLETALTITNERISMTVDANDGSAPTLVLDNVTGATSGTSNDLNYITNNDAALMQLELSAANTNYVGRARVTITDAANHCPVFEDFTILPAQVYDSLVLGSDLLDINVSTNGDKTGYSLTQAFPTNFADLAITVTTGRVTVGTNADKTGYSISGAKTTLDALHDIDGSSVTVTTNSDKTGYALTSLYDFAKGTAAMTEAYAANGAAPTPTQALFAIHQMLMQFMISGTQLIVKQLDNATPAFIVTLDSATAPTSAERQ